MFLSYGHDSNEELVRRIKSDLEKRGHDVWFDKTEIKSGHDWRRSIAEGIMDSHRVLSFLSKYSTRDPGVCLDEIGIAVGVKGGGIQTILVESEKEVRPPASISHIQWLDMHDWRQQRDAGGATWDRWYQEKLAEIITVVESDESRRFAGEIGTLAEYLKPTSSDSRMFPLLKKGLVGRQWLVDAIEDWRNADRASRLFWIMGAPGVGKSAFAAHLAHYGRDKVIAVQFCQYDKSDHRDARRVVRTLAFQIATRLPDYRKLLLALPEIGDLDRKNPSELFDYLLANPLRHAIDGGRERYLIVIDALDEAVDGDRNPLVELLARDAQRLPDWLGVVVTSRPEFDVTGPLQGLKPFVLDTATESNRRDIREYLHMELADPLSTRPNPDRLMDQILDKSEGVFLYAERFCEDVRHGHLSLDHPEQFPLGLGGIFHQYFQRQFPDLERFRRDVRPTLRAIVAAREPLPLEILQRLFKWQDEEMRDFTRSLGSVFPVTTEAGTEVIKPCHRSILDWLTDEAKAGSYFVSAEEGHRMLADYFQAQPLTARVVNELPWQLAEMSEWHRLRDLLADLTFLEAAWRQCPLDVQDYWRRIKRHAGLSAREAYKNISELVSRGPDTVSASGQGLGPDAQLIRLPDGTFVNLQQIQCVGELLESLGNLGGLAFWFFLLVQCGRLNDENGRDNAALHMAEDCRRSGQVGLAKQLQEAPLKRAEERGDRRALAEITHALAKTNEDLGELDRAIELYEESEGLFRELRDDVHLALATGGRAGVMQKKGRLEEALRLLSDAERMVRPSADRRALAVILDIKGLNLQTRWEADQLKQAWEAYNESIQILKELNSPWDIVKPLYHLAYLFETIADLDNAAKLYGESKRIAQQIDDKRGLALSMGGEARVLHARGDTDGAGELFKRQEEICDEVGDPEGLMISLGNQARMLHEPLKRPREALNMATKALQLAVKHGYTVRAEHLKRIIEAIGAKLD